MIADTACGYCAFSLMPAGCSIVTVEYKINILAPARGSLVAKARVVKPGRTLTIARGRCTLTTASTSPRCSRL
jgi:acyl-coenzyme A thioesterase PaaI-like protein